MTFFHMPRSTSIIPKAPLAEIVLAAGAKRVSADAAEELSVILTELATDISTMAVKIAKHSGRKTILDTDIKLAYKQ